MTDNLNPAGIDAAMAMLSHYGVKEEHARIAIRAYEAERGGDGLTREQLSRMDQHVLIRMHDDIHRIMIEQHSGVDPIKVRNAEARLAKAAMAVRKGNEG